MGSQRVGHTFVTEKQQRGPQFSEEALSLSSISFPHSSSSLSPSSLTLSPLAFPPQSPSPPPPCPPGRQLAMLESQAFSLYLLSWSSILMITWKCEINGKCFVLQRHNKCYFSTDAGGWSWQFFGDGGEVIESPTSPETEMVSEHLLCTAVLWYFI